MSDATGPRRGTPARAPRAVDPDLAFAAAYATALGSCLVSSGLTYLYVGPGVRELNPVVRGLIAWLGPAGMVAARTLVVVGAFWGYHALRDATRWPRLPVAFAWIGALVHLLDAGHDLRVAATAGPVPPADVRAGLLLVTAAALVGIALRPPSTARGAGGPAAGSTDERRTPAD